MSIPDQSSADRPVRLLLNAEVVEIYDIDPTRSVLDFLREDRHCTGTKEGCAEGDCGACTVVVGDLNADNTLSLRTVTACIQFLPMLDGKALFTVEYLRRQGRELHPVQQAMVEHHGSQCGFCTPGFVMSMWASYAHNTEAGVRPGRAALANELSGNLCRCTGYRPILDAAEAMFDLPLVRFDRDAIARQLQSVQSDAALELHHRGRRYIAPQRFDDLLRWRAELPEATLLAGCTDIGLWVSKQFRDLGDIVYLGDVPELQQIEHTATHLRIGAGVSLTNAYAALAGHYPELRSLWERFASVPIRNAGTLGGNVANGSPIGDSMPGLIALQARVVLASQRARRTLALEDLYLVYMKNALQPDEIVESIEVPLPSSLAGSGLRFRTYKVSKRYDVDISAVCAAFSILLDGDQITGARVAFGGMAAVPQRAAACEQALLGQVWHEVTARTAMQALGQDFTPMDDLRGSAGYRSRVAQNLLYRFFLETRPSRPLTGHQTSVFSPVEATS